MSLYDFARSDWGARSATSVRALDYTKVKHAIVHYPGTSAPIGTDTTAIAKALRGWQDYHIDKRGWTDLAYNVAVDQAGRIWEGRGLDRRDGATSGLGGVSMSILAILANDETPTDDMLAGILRVFAEVERRQPSVRRSWHSAHSSTSCPGDALRAWGKGGWAAPASGLVVVTPDTAAPAAPAGYDNPYTPLSVDGIWGTQTTQALQHMLRHKYNAAGLNGTTLAVDGIVGKNTYRALQRVLNQEVGAALVEDGIFGPKTKRALQGWVGTTVDGIVGTNTIRALQALINKNG